MDEFSKIDSDRPQVYPSIILMYGTPQLHEDTRKVIAKQLTARAVRPIPPDSPALKMRTIIRDYYQGE